MTNDEIFNNVINFIKNNKFKHKGISNIYVVRKTNLNGDLLGEYYGRNLMTDYGMTRYFVNQDSFPSNVYIGNGSGSFNNTGNTLLSAIITEPAKISDNSISYGYPLYYDEISGIITCICKFKTCYFDYNISGVTDPIVISEYGIGAAYNALWTHSWVYDTSGNKTTITKNPNERLTMTIFVCLSYQENLITQGWENGRYTVITSMNQFFNKMNESSVYTYTRSGETINRTINRTRTAYMNNEVSLNTNLNTFLITKQDNSQGYIDGFCQYSEGFITLESQTLENPESFERIVSFNSFTDKYDLANQFGVNIDNSNLPFTQADISSVSLYNYKTDEWNIEEEFYNYPKYRYSETMSFINLATPIWYTNNNTIQKMYVYQNLYTDNPIIKLSGNVSTVYATDKYWDTSSWIHISDYSNIPESVRTMKYWITNSNTVGIIPIRLHDKFHIISEDDVSDINIGNYITGSIICENPNNDWIAWNSNVFFFSYNKKIDIPDSVINTYDRIIATWDKFLFTDKFIDGSNKYFICDTSVVNTNTSSLEGTLYPCYCNLWQNAFSETETGIFVSSNDDSICDIIDIKNNVVYNQINANRATCVWGTDRIAILIKDSNEIVIEECTPEGLITFKNISFNCNFTNYIFFGHTDHLFIINIQDSTFYHINVNDETVTVETHEGGWFVEYPFNNYRYSMIDDTIILYSYSANSLSKIYYIDINHPDSIKSLGNIDSTNYNDSTRVKCKLKQVKNNALLLLISFIKSPGSSDSDVQEFAVDFGYFLKTGNVYSKYISKSKSSSLMTYGNYIIFNGNKKIPIEYFLPHKIIGTTDTIGTVNTSKQISNKQWSITVTNIPKFNGLPPGNIQ